MFGEDALANLSIEKPVGGAEGGASTTGVQGHIRIRAKTQVSDQIMSSGHVTFYDVMVVSCDLSPGYGPEHGRQDQPLTESHSVVMATRQ